MRLRTITLILTLALGLLGAPGPAEAQRAGKVWQIGFLATTPPRPASLHIYEAFWQGLRELGYVEGQNISFEYRFAKGRPERFPELAAELVHLQVDIIVASGIPAALAAKHATKTIPIVFPVVGDAIAAGLVASLARPGGNLTGLTVLFPELAAKRLQLLKEAVPGLTRVAVLWNSANPGKVLDWRKAQAAARLLGVTLESREVKAPDDFEKVFAAISRERPDALFVLGDPFTFRYRKQIVDFGAKSRLPAMYEWRELAEAGGLMSYGPDLADLFRRSASYIDKILKGAKPADLPVEQPTKFNLLVNLKTAEALDLTIPPSVLFQADKVIK